MSTVKHGSSSIVMFECFAATGTVKIVRVDGTMVSARSQTILNEIVLSSFRKLSLRRGWMLQQDNDSTQQSKSTKNGAEKKKKYQNHRC